MKTLTQRILGLGVLMLPVVSFGMLTASQQTMVDTAADQIVQIMERDDISIGSFISLLQKFETRLEGNDTKLMILDALREATLDEYYQVDNFSSCESYNDGCNTCIVTEGYEIACTKRACFQQGTPECLQYEGDDMNEQDPITTLQIECENAGGTFLSLYNECEGIGEDTCDELGGEFNECASACRNQPEGSICTMQCVLVCDLNTDMTASPVGIKTWEVAPYTQECTGVGPMDCLQVRELPFQEDYTNFYDTIEGFDFQEGVKYEIEVEVTERENVPADASQYKYTLVQIIRQTQVEDHSSTQAALDEAIMLRESQELTDYTITQSYSCFCPREYTRPIMYSVVGGELDMSDASYADEDMEAIDPELSPELRTISEAFDFIQDAIDRSAASITVTYDQTLGYPMSIAIDYDEMMADEEAYYTYEVN